MPIKSFLTNMFTTCRCDGYIYLPIYVICLMDVLNFESQPFNLKHYAAETQK